MMRSGLISRGLSEENGAISAIVPDVSVVVPVRDEVESLPLLLEAIANSVSASQVDYEIICVDDGSTDGSAQFLKQQAQIRNDLKAVILRRNYGQTAAMAAGFYYAMGKRSLL